MTNDPVLRSGTILLLLFAITSGFRPEFCQPATAGPPLDLKEWSAKVHLENAVLGKQAWEAGFWTAPELCDAKGRPLHGRPPAGRAHRYPLEFAPKILPETFSVLVGLLYGHGDFRKSVSLATMCGFDTDCNAGTVGCLMGLRNGLDGIPADWKDPLDDTYELQITGLPRKWKIGELARQIAETGAALARSERQPTRTSGAAAIPGVVTPTKTRTGKITLMALGDNRLTDFEPLVHRYDLMTESYPACAMPTVGTTKMAYTQASGKQRREAKGRKEYEATSYARDDSSSGGGNHPSPDPKPLKNRQCAPAQGDKISTPAAMASTALRDKGAGCN